jgi:hypothetical protein
MEAKIKKIQTVFFTRNFNIPNDVFKASFLTRLNGYSSQIFNGQPQMLPIPNDAPQEFPRFILSSSDNMFNCNISLLRTDIFYNIPDLATESNEQLLEKQKTNSQNIFSFLIREGIGVNRIGFIIVAEKALGAEEGDALSYLRNNFIRDNKLNNPKELVINYNRASQSENFEMNNLITVNTKENTSIIIQIDINTLAERMNGVDFTLENFYEIISYAIRESQVFSDNFPNI